MTELEILAQLKIAFMSIEDIIDNSDIEQITKKDYNWLYSTMCTISSVYENTYKAIKKKNYKYLEYEKDVYISNVIENDFMIKNKDWDIDYIGYDQTDKQTKWYEDLEFLNYTIID